MTYVIGKSGNPLMPTERGGRVRILLKTGMAEIVSMKPFTVRLLYDTPEVVQPLHGGTDPGRTNIGEAVLSEDGKVVYAAHLETQNKSVPKRMQKRAACRHASRRGERKRKQRRARKNGTVTNPSARERVLLKCEEPIINKWIKNSESRFANRKREPEWLTPTANHLVQTTLHMVDKILRILPVKTWTLEVNRFAFMQMEDGSIRGVDFQNGRMKGYSSVEDYVFNLQDGRCACCGKKIARRDMKFHHIVERHNGGSDGPENRAGLCEDCHVKIHQGVKETIAQLKKVGQKKKYAALSVLNQAVPYIYDGLVDRFGVENVFLCTGRETAAMRDAYGLPKEHYTDAMCIASIGAGVAPYDDGCHIYEVKQFRRHDRAIIKNQKERTYKLDGKVVAKNRKPRFEQNGPSLKDYLETLPESERRLACSQLVVTKSKRHYNNTKREYLPGCIILHNGKRYVMSGQSNTGGYYTAVGIDGRIPISKCRVIKTGGLVYVE